jgi:hypothetical protein
VPPCSLENILGFELRASALSLQPQKIFLMKYFHIPIKQCLYCKIMIVEVGGGGKVAQTMYAHVSKCKNDKIKKNVKKKRL